MGKERAPLNMVGDDLDLSGFQPRQVPAKSASDAKVLSDASESAGFVSRESVGSRRRRRVVSPFKSQLNLKCREGMRLLFQDIGERMQCHDHTTFELALLALIEKEGFDDLRAEYRNLSG